MDHEPDDPVGLIRIAYPQPYNIFQNMEAEVSESDSDTGSDESGNTDVVMEDAGAVDCHGQTCYSAARQCPQHCICSARKINFLSALFDLGASACVAVVVKDAKTSGLGGRSVVDDAAAGPASAKRQSNGGVLHDSNLLQPNSTGVTNLANGEVSPLSNLTTSSTNISTFGGDQPVHRFNASNAVLTDLSGGYYNFTTKERIACFCNETYISYGCCDAGPSNFMVHEALNMRLGPPGTS